MTAMRFQMLLWIYVAIIVAACISGFIQGISEAHPLANHGDPNAQHVGLGWTFGAFLLGMLIALVVAVIGLFGFASWSRPLSLVITALGTVSPLFFAPSLSSGIDSVLSEAATTVWGAILALSYSSPISSRFNREGATNLRN